MIVAEKFDPRRLAPADHLPFWNGLVDRVCIGAWVDTEAAAFSAETWRCSVGASFLTKWIQLHIACQFPFERVIGHFDFTDIDAAVAASKSGRIVKPELRVEAE